jgi:hypothetical protein
MRQDKIAKAKPAGLAPVGSKPLDADVGQDAGVEATVSDIDKVLSGGVVRVQGKRQICVCHACGWIGCPVTPRWHDEDSIVPFDGRPAKAARNTRADGPFPSLSPKEKGVSPVERWVSFDTPSGVKHEAVGRTYLGLGGDERISE